MPRSKRVPPWEPITINISPEARRLLRHAAAEEDSTPGAILDQLVLARYGVLPAPPEARPEPKPKPKPGPKARPKGRSAPAPAAPPPFTVPDLLRMLVDLGLTTAALAREFAAPTSARTVSGWVSANQIPADRQEELRGILDRLTRR